MTGGGRRSLRILLGAFALLGGALACEQPGEGADGSEARLEAESGQEQPSEVAAPSESEPEAARARSGEMAEAEVLGSATTEVTAAPATLVVGSVEVDLKGSRYVPAEHFYVVLRGERSFQAFTDRAGDYYLENVPPGRYVRTVSVGRGPPVVTDTVRIGEGERVELDHVHITEEDLAALPGRTR